MYSFLCTDKIYTQFRTNKNNAMNKHKNDYTCGYYYFETSFYFLILSLLVFDRSTPINLLPKLITSSFYSLYLRL